jgi:hypothetical protein
MSVIPEQLEEYRFTFGDPRPLLYDYLNTFNNYKPLSDTKQLKKNDIITYNCNEKNKRNMILPTKRKFAKLIKNYKGIIVISVKLMGKYRCRIHDRSQHMCLVLYNTHTHELERIDMKRYHIHGFSLKHLVNKLYNNLLEWIQQFDPLAHYYHEIDVNISFMKKMGKDTIKEVFPLFVISYLNVKNDHRELVSDKILTKTTALGKKKVIKYWNSYVEWRKQNNTIDKKKCKDGFIKNLETNKCMSPLSRTYREYLCKKPILTCGDLVYDHLRSKCVTPDKVKTINILLDEIMKMRVTNKIKFTHLGFHDIGVKAVNFVLEKYPYAKLIIPIDKPKLKSVIRWLPTDNSQKFRLELPDDLWELWESALYNPAIQFLIVLVTLISSQGGVHANVLIYDKHTNEMERFDGLGQYTHESYNLDEFDPLIKQIWSEKMSNYHQLASGTRPFKYYTPTQYCPKFSIFQSKEIDDIPGHDMNGNCAVWRIWYIHIRLANPHLRRKELVSFAVKKLENTGNLYKFIKAYQLYITKQIK